MASEPKTTLLLNDWLYLQTLKLLNYSRVFKLRIINYNIITVKAFNDIVTNPRNCLNWKKSKIIMSRYLNFFICDILSSSCNA